MPDLLNAAAAVSMALSSQSGVGEVNVPKTPDSFSTSPIINARSFDQEKTELPEGYELSKSNSSLAVYLGETGALTPKEREVIEERGGIFLGQFDYMLKRDSPLGAYDQYGNFYSTAIPEGGTFNLDGLKFQITYETGYFEEITFLHDSNDGTLIAGQVLPYIVFLPSDAYGKAFKVTNYADSSKGIHREVYTDTREKNAGYAVMPVVTTFPSSILPPSVNEKGGITIGEYEKFNIKPARTTGSTTGYLSWVLMKVTHSPDSGFTLETLGILEPSSDNKLYMEFGNLPEDLVSLYEITNN